MKQFTVGQTVYVPSGRIGIISAIIGQKAIVRFDESGTDSAEYNIATLTYVR